LLQPLQHWAASTQIVPAGLQAVPPQVPNRQSMLQHWVSDRQAVPSGQHDEPPQTPP
jgi:hypothetical protein